MNWLTQQREIQQHNNKLFRRTRHNSLLRARLCGCALCGDPRGGTYRVCKFLKSDDGEWRLVPERVSFAQCPDCVDQPLTDDERHARLLEAESRLLASPQFASCPCCARGVIWMPFDGQAAPQTIYSQ